MQRIALKASIYYYIYIFLFVNSEICEIALNHRRFELSDGHCQEN